MGRMKEIEGNISKEDNEVLDKFLNDCSLSCGEDKLEQRKRYALQFLDIAEQPFSNFDRDIIVHIYSMIKNSYREVTGKNEAIKNLKYFIRWLKDDENLLKSIKSISQRKGYNTNKINSSTLINNDEIEVLIRMCRNMKEKAMVTLQIELGLRPHELLGLRWEDIMINDDVGEIRIFANKTRDTRVLPFKTSLIHVSRWKDEYGFPNRKEKDFVFPNPLNRKSKLYKTYVSQLYRRLCKDGKIRSIYPYLARHTKLTEINKKVPSKVASAYGGHSEKIANNYTHLNETDIRDIILEQIYNIKEPNIKDRKKLEIKVDMQGKEIDNLKEMVMKMAEKGHTIISKNI